jgi:hypothetical protein
MSEEYLQAMSQAPQSVHWKNARRASSLISARPSPKESAITTRPPPEWLWSLYSR